MTLGWAAFHPHATAVYMGWPLWGLCHQLPCLSGFWEVDKTAEGSYQLLSARGSQLGPSVGRAMSFSLSKLPWGYLWARRLHDLLMLLSSLNSHTFSEPYFIDAYMYMFIYFWDMVSLRNSGLAWKWLSRPGWPWTYIAPPVSASLIGITSICLWLHLLASVFNQWQSHMQVK